MRSAWTPEMRANEAKTMRDAAQGAFEALRKRLVAQASSQRMNAAVEIVLQRMQGEIVSIFEHALLKRETAMANDFNAALGAALTRACVLQNERVRDLYSLIHGHLSDEAAGRLPANGIDPTGALDAALLLERKLHEEAPARWRGHQARERVVKNIVVKVLDPDLGESVFFRMKKNPNF